MDGIDLRPPPLLPTKLRLLIDPHRTYPNICPVRMGPISRYTATLRRHVFITALVVPSTAVSLAFNLINYVIRTGGFDARLSVLWNAHVSSPLLSGSTILYTVCLGIVGILYNLPLLLAIKLL